MTTKRKATGIPKNTFRSAYNLGNENYSETFTDGITEQHHTDQCDINKILAQFMETLMAEYNSTAHIPTSTTHSQYLADNAQVAEQNTLANGRCDSF